VLDAQRPCWALVLVHSKFCCTSLRLADHSVLLCSPTSSKSEPASARAVVSLLVKHVGELSLNVSATHPASALLPRGDRSHRPTAPGGRSLLRQGTRHVVQVAAHICAVFASDVPSQVGASSSTGMKDHRSCNTDGYLDPLAARTGPQTGAEGTQRRRWLAGRQSPLRLFICFLYGTVLNTVLELCRGGRRSMTDCIMGLALSLLALEMRAWLGRARG
jgi:hypothetical protein